MADSALRTITKQPETLLSRSTPAAPSTTDITPYSVGLLPHSCGDRNQSSHVSRYAQQICVFSMKLGPFTSAREEGVALVVTMVLGSILGVLMISYLSMLDNQNRAVARGQAWNKALVVAEAGVEEAMAQLNAPGVSLNNLAVNSWTSTGTSTVCKTNVVGDSYSYVTIFATNSAPVVVSTSYVPGPIGTPMLSRSVQITAKSGGGPTVSGAMIVVNTINFNGQGIMTDSFNSATNRAVIGLPIYTNLPTLVADHGDISTLSTQTNAIQVSNGTVNGSVHTGKNGQVSIGTQGVVGDFSYTGNKNNLGTIESGHAGQDAPSSFPDATLPSETFWYTPPAGNYVINGVTYKYLINDSKPYELSVLDGSVYFKGTNCTLWVTSDIQIGTKGQVTIGPSGSVNMYVSATNPSIGGNGIVNESGYAANFNYYGLPSNTGLTISANTAFVGRIYAPEADFTLNGGGTQKTPTDFTGQSITKSATMGGHFKFHYDQAAPILQGGTGIAVTSWAEL